MVFGNGVKNIQAAAYNGARTVYGPDSINGNPLPSTVPSLIYKSPLLETTKVCIFFEVYNVVR